MTSLLQRLEAKKKCRWTELRNGLMNDMNDETCRWVGIVH